MSLKAAVFDFDGLILPTEEAEFEAWTRVYAGHGATLGWEEWSVCIGTAGGFDPVGRLRQLTGKDLDGEAVQAQRRVINDELNRRTAVLPGVLDRLAEGRALGLKLGIASSSAGPWVEDHLAARELRGWFDAVVVRTDALPAKPRPDLYLAALAALGVRADEAVAFEDSMNGIAAAKAAGMFTVAVPNPMTVRMNLSRADLLVRSLAEITFTELAERLNKEAVR